MDHAEEHIQYKNITKLETGEYSCSTSKLGLFTVTGAMIVLASMSCEIGKQVSSYSINYYNRGTYPLPQTLLVMLSEVLKLLGIFLCMKCQTPSFNKLSVKSSLKYLLPGVIYVINNNIYFGKFLEIFNTISHLTYYLNISSCLASCTTPTFDASLQLQNRHHNLFLQIHPQERCHSSPVPWIILHCAQHCCGQIR